MRVYYTTKDYFDGSYGVFFFDSLDSINMLEKQDPDAWACGYGGGSFVADNIQEIKIYSYEEAKELVE
jgi:hypothetical protein